MTVSRVAIVLAFVVVLGVPFALRPASEARRDDAEVLIVITPHVQQIRFEFGAAFDRWYHARTGRHVRIDWRTPGGTSEIIKQLEAQYAAAIKAGLVRPDGSCQPGAVGVDLMFGGGTYDHGRLKTGVRVMLDGPDGRPVEAAIPMSVPAEFAPERLAEWFGRNLLGTQPLYDPEQYWIGTALSSFGIVYNRDVLTALGVPEPRSFADLTDPRFTGWLALADPRQSGSITTTFDSILNAFGWEQGWRILRAVCANTRYYTNSSTKPPIDVSQGEAAAGLAIDFYGRSQAQAVGGNRVGYVDPEGSVYVDADPASILRGGPNPDLARAFIEFCLSEEAQSLWQLQTVESVAPAGQAAPEGYPAWPEGDPAGPVRYALRRLPVRRVMYERFLPFFIDQVNPFEIASETPSRGWRSAIGPMMGAFAIDMADEQRAAWRAMHSAAARAGSNDPTVLEMGRLFYAWPEHEFPDGTRLAFSPEHFGRIRAAWRDPAQFERARLAYTAFFREQYSRIVALAEQQAGGR